jgi:hypothetical protein
MPLDFPASPVDGDVYGSYVWNDTVGAWQSRSGALVIMSETAPAAPTVGQLWFDETQGKMYVYYDDGTSQQWVSAVGGYASAINTDDSGVSRIFVGSIDPDVDYTLATGDVWIEAP